MNKKLCAVFTMVKDEKFNLPLWIDYYGKIFGYDNIYVMDHDTEDGSTDNLPCEVTKYHHKYRYNAQWMLDRLFEKQDELFQRYHYTIHPDVDEFIIPDPNRHNNLRSYVKQLYDGGIKTIACRGYEVLHRRFIEPPLDWSNRPVMKQRKYWTHLTTYDKPIVTAKKLGWVQGKHFDSREKHPRDDSLILCHIHRIDYDTCREMTCQKAECKWTEGLKNVEHPNKYLNEDFDRYFDSINVHQKWKAEPTKLECIPERFKIV